MGKTVEFFITKKEWGQSYSKWLTIVAALSGGELARARRAFNRGCGYCSAFNHSLMRMRRKYPDFDEEWSMMDRCTGCTLSKRKVCVNDPDEMRRTAYWALKELFDKTLGLPPDKKAVLMQQMLPLAEKIYNAIREDEGIAIERRPR